MKYLKLTILSIMALCFVATKGANAFVCPMMMNQQAVSQNKDMSSHCEDMQQKDSMQKANCDDCQCTHCNQIPTLGLAIKSKDIKISKKLSIVDENYDEFLLALLSPPPKLS